MNTDIRINIMFLQHPKTVKLRKRLGDGAIISILSLWCFTAQSRPEGALLGMDAEDIEISAQWDGEAGIFVKTLLDLRLMDKEDEVYSIHDWQENNPWVADFENRSAKGKKAVNARWERERKRKESILNDTHSIPVVSESVPVVIPPNEVSNTPFLSLPSLPLPTTEEVSACERMSLSDAQKLHAECLGKIPHNPLSITVLRDICKDYPPDRIKVAFKAVVSAERPNLNWIKAYLDNPKNWNKSQQTSRSKHESESAQIRAANAESCREFAGGNDAG